LTPFLSVRDAAGAVEFYKGVFGAVVLEAHGESDGKISTAHLRIGDSQLMISDETSEHMRRLGVPDDARSPDSLGGTSCSVIVFVHDCDTVFAQALAAGAKMVRPLADRPWGDRTGEFKDPFGHVWGVATHKRDVAAPEH
jgi:PhnB protein